MSLLHSSSSEDIDSVSTSSDLLPRVTRSRASSGGLSHTSPQSGGMPSKTLEKSDQISEDEDAESELLSDICSDFEETLKKRLKRIHRLTPRETTATKRQRRGDNNNSTLSTDLYEAVRQGKGAMQIIVDDWLDSYKQERESGLLELINFLMQSCGCKGVVTQEMLEHMQNADIIRRMTEEFDEDTSDYPLSLSTLPWKKFRLNFGEFIETLVSRCQYNIIYDELLMDAFISLLTGLSDSQVRAFRHTSTFAAMKLMTGLVKVAQNLSVHQETNQRQYDVERAKIPVKMAPERLETLLEKRKELQENLQEIANMMNGIFKGVFVHRYRDTVPEIRALCMEEIGVWMHTYSKSFLNDSYLKYVGWTLHDKQGHVRLQCIRSLKGLYSVPEMAAKMELFTSRFKERMVSMVLDKDQQVAVEAIKVLGLISQNMEDILNTEDCESVYPLVYASSRALSSAAGAFLYQRLLDIKSNELSPKDRCRRESNALFFRLLVTFFIESEFHEHAAYLVDSLWDCAASQLRDWECQTDLLVVESLDNREEIAVIEIMVSAMRQAVEGTSPVGRVPVRKVVSVKDKKIQSEDKVRLTRHMILILPQLLAKFSADAEKMITLLKVPGFLELDLYCTERLEKHLDLLLAQVHDVLEKHTEPDVLEACSRALYILCDKEQTSYRRSDIARSHMLDQLTDRFFQQIPDILQSSDLDEDEVYNTAATLKRLSALYSAHDLSRWELFDPCSRILRRGIDTGEISEQIVLPALTCCHFSLMWELSHLSNSNATQDKLDSLRKKMCLFCDICQSCLSDVKVTVREQAFILLSDLLVIFGGHIGRGNQSHLQILVYRPEPPLQAELAGFLLDHVFIDHEEKEQGVEETQQIFLLHHRRNLLAGYCKLILYGALQLHSASEVFRHYAKYYTDYGDLIKETLHRSRSINKEESTRAVLLSLTQAYTSHCLEGSSPPQRTSRFLLEIRELARQFALLFGPDQLRIRQDIVLLHKEGIKFCLRDPQTPGKRSQNLRFLDILSEFSPKLIKQDKRVILEYLEQTCKQYLPPQISDDDYLLSPLLAYKRSLGTDSDTSVTPSHGATRRSGARSRGQRKRPKISPPRKKRKTNEDIAKCSKGIMEVRGKNQPPLMTSTLLREKRGPPAAVREDDEGSDIDFEPSPSWHSIRFPQKTSSTGQTHSETPVALSTDLHRLSLMEEEEDELLIEEAESSEHSEAEEHLPDLLDSAILDSEDDLRYATLQRQ